MKINPYLNFDGNCREVMTFYQKCLGAELEMMTFGQAPCDMPPAAKDRIMHARLTKGEAILMASDTPPDMALKPGNNHWVSIQCESNEEIEKFFTALSEKGTVKMPLQDMFWGARFGMLVDRFGIQWMFNFEHPKKG